MLKGSVRSTRRTRDLAAVCIANQPWHPRPPTASLRPPCPPHRHLPHSTCMHTSRCVKWFLNQFPKFLARVRNNLLRGPPSALLRTLGRVWTLYSFTDPPTHPSPPAHVRPQSHPRRLLRPQPGPCRVVSPTHRAGPPRVLHRRRPRALPGRRRGHRGALPAQLRGGGRRRRPRPQPVRPRGPRPAARDPRRYFERSIIS